jgi:hypothetical protein
MNQKENEVNENFEFNEKDQEHYNSSEKAC